MLAIPLPLAISPAPAAAQQSVQFDIPPGRLSSSIRQLARQASISIATTDSQVRSIRARAVKGRLSPGEALNVLLQGTPFRAIRIGVGSYRIERRPQAPRQVTQASRPAAAPPPPPPPPQPIIVEASKNASAAFDYPAGIKVLGLDDPNENPTGRSLDQALEVIPTVNGTALGSGRNKIFLRGIADSSFNGPTQSTIGLYLGEQRLIFSAPNPDLRLYDVESVELLEGPQGTLYGAGTIAGLLRINPNSPDSGAIATNGWAGAGYTADGGASWDLGAMANLPLGENLALRVVGYSGEDTGYINDPSRGVRDVNAGSYWGGRAALGFEPNSDWEIELSGFGQVSELDDGQYIDAGLPGLSRTDQLAQPFEATIYGGALTLKSYLGSAEFISTTGIVRHELKTVFDSSVLTGDPSSQAFQENREVELFTHETRLSGGDPSSFNWLIGTSTALNQDKMSQIFRSVDGQSPPPFADLTYSLDEVAVFGELNYQLASAWTLTAGGRVLRTKATGERSFGPNTIVEPREGPTRFLPALALSWKPAEGWMAYARFQEGFRTGGVTIERDQNRDPQTARFEPDKVMSYEAGVRANLGAQFPLQLSLTTHFADWSDIQADLVNLQGFPITRNIGDGDIFGIDGSVVWENSKGWTLSLSGAYNDAKVDRELPNGGVAKVQAPNVPDVSATARVAKSWQLGKRGDWGLAANGRYLGRSFLDIDQQVRVEQGNLGVLDASAWWSNGGLSLRLDVLNLTNSRGNRFAFGNPFTVRSEDQATPLRPRSVRIQLSIAH